MMKTYTAEVSRDGKFWIVHVPEIDQYTQARAIREVVPMATDLISVMTGETEGTFEVAVSIAVPELVADRLAHVAELREQAAKAQAEAAAEYAVVARLLHSDGLPYRDVGAVLKVSHQRAAQLVAEASGGRQQAAGAIRSGGDRSAHLSSVVS